ncbi:MAG: single-stranded DNA-binding protein [Oscillospiraceae bacterium]|nr:single-stranded DNA-binding protein [Oscillospiraceae bacterium]
MEQIVNQIRLCGSMVSPPKLSHENHGKRFFTFPLEIPRLSGTTDTLQIIAQEEVLEQGDPFAGGLILVTGQIRSFNRRTEKGRKLLISVYAETLTTCEDEPANEVCLQGAICKDPVFRRTPLGREICDIMLAVNRPYNRTDYLPCIFWGHTAEELSLLPVGAVITLTGRLQSRAYLKQLESGREQRVAYEISALSAAPITE